MSDSSNPFVNGELPETYISVDRVRATVLALIDEVETLRGQLNSVRGILERSPECHKYPAESTPHCGWKSDLNAIRETLNGAGAGEGDA